MYPVLEETMIFKFADDLPRLSSQNTQWMRKCNQGSKHGKILPEKCWFDICRGEIGIDQKLREENTMHQSRSQWTYGYYATGYQMRVVIRTKLDLQGHSYYDFQIACSPTTAFAIFLLGKCVCCIGETV